MEWDKKRSKEMVPQMAAAVHPILCRKPASDVAALDSWGNIRMLGVYKID